MNYQPFPIDTTKQERFVAAAVQLTLVFLQRCFEFDIGDSPCKVALDMGVDI